MDEKKHLKFYLFIIRRRDIGIDKEPYQMSM
jgi:hypothetical protein